MTIEEVAQLGATLFPKMGRWPSCWPASAWPQSLLGLSSGGLGANLWNSTLRVRSEVDRNSCAADNQFVWHSCIDVRCTINYPSAFVLPRKARCDVVVFRPHRRRNQEGSLGCNRSLPDPRSFGRPRWSAISRVVEVQSRRRVHRAVVPAQVRSRGFGAESRAAARPNRLARRHAQRQLSCGGSACTVMAAHAWSRPRSGQYADLHKRVLLV